MRKLVNAGKWCQYMCSICILFQISVSVFTFEPEVAMVYIGIISNTLSFLMNVMNECLMNVFSCKQTKKINMESIWSDGFIIKSIYFQSSLCKNMIEKWLIFIRSGYCSSPLSKKLPDEISQIIDFKKLSLQLRNIQEAITIYIQTHSEKVIQWVQKASFTN